jgi:NADH dehydrogenase/NADH:ubiquinone oxidoreductase subunit G
MSEIRLQIDGQEVEAKEGMTVLQAAQGAGISIPTLCHHEKLEPFGGCRICIVEACCFMCLSGSGKFGGKNPI